MEYISIKNDIINLIEQSKEKIFVIIGYNSTGKSEIIKELKEKGYKTEDDFICLGQPIPENFITEKDKKFIFVTKDLSNVLYKLLYYPNAVIIITHNNNIYDVFLIENFKGKVINSTYLEKDNTLKTLLRISSFYWSDFLQSIFNSINTDDISKTNKLIYDSINNNIKKRKTINEK